MEIDLGSVFLNAALLVAIKFTLAATVFFIFSFGLIGATRDTAIKNGRWVGALLAAISIISNPTTHKSNLDIYVGGTIMVILWFLIGFIAGLAWWKFSSLKSSTKTLYVDLKKTKNISQFVFLVIAILLALLFQYFYNTKAPANNLASTVKEDKVKLASLSSTKRYALDDGRVIKWQNNKECYVSWSDKVKVLTSPIQNTKFRELTQNDELVAVVYFPINSSDNEIKALLDQESFLRVKKLCSDN